MKEASPPVSSMATPTNGSGNLVDEFEESFQHCLYVLTKEEAVPSVDKEEIKVEVEQTTLRFIDLARQMEAFFLQKRFLLSALKPEMVVKEDISELRLELARKEELLKRHYEKIAVWQNLLADLKVYNRSPSQPTLPTQGSLSNPMAQQLMQQHHQMQLLQQQMQVSPGPMDGMVSPPAPFLQQRLPFPPQAGMLQSPLAFLEKTTSNIGMNDGRR